MFRVYLWNGALGRYTVGVRFDDPAAAAQAARDTLASASQFIGHARIIRESDGATVEKIERVETASH